VSPRDVPTDEMSRSFDPDDPAAIGDVFADDLRSAYPEAGVSARTADDHVAAMMAAARILAEGSAPAPDPASDPSRPDGWLTIPRRRSMRGRMVRRVVAVAAALVLSLGGLALAGAFQSSGDDLGDDDPQGIVADLPDDQGEDADDQGEDADDQGEDADDQGEDADDQGEDADDQGEDADDQGEDENDGAGDEGDESNDDGDSDGGDDDQQDDQGGDSQD